MWAVPESKGLTRTTTAVEAESLKLVYEGCDPKMVGTSILFFILSLYLQE